MKIISIALQNIASIEGEHLIELEQPPLQHAGLFALTGATGAGKSTLLDAICLALYNNTPRLAQLRSGVNMADGSAEIGIKDVKTLLRKGASSGYAKVTFTAIDDQTYRAEWHVRRAHNKVSGAVQAEQMTLYNVTEDRPFPENRKTWVLAEIERLVGLTFEQFTKAVLLAQGEFTSFLKSDDDLRAAILEKLTGTEKYRWISERVFLREKEERLALEKLDLEMEHLQVLTPEQEDEQQVLMKDLVVQIQQLEEQQKQIQKIVDWYSNLTKLQQTKNYTYQEVLSLQAEKEAQKQRRHFLSEVENLQEIKPVLLQLSAEKKKISDLEKNISDHQSTFVALEELLTTTQQKLEDTTAKKALFDASYEERSQHIIDAQQLEVTHAEQLKAQTELGHEQEVLQQKLTAQKDKKTASENLLEEAQKKLQKIKDWQQSHASYEELSTQSVWLTALFQQAREKLQETTRLSRSFTDIQQKETQQNQRNQELELQLQALNLKEKEAKHQLQLIRVTTEFSSREDLEKKFENDKQEAETLQNALNIAQELSSYTTDCSINLQNKHTLLREKDTLSETLTRWNNLLIKSETEVKVFQEIYDQWKWKQAENVVFLREQLTEGQPCIVCGSLTHPLLEKEPKAQAMVDDVQHQLNTAQRQLEHHLQQQKDVQMSAVLIDQELAKTTERIATLEASIEKKQLDWNSLHLFAFETDRCDEIVQQLLETLKEAEKKLEATTAQRKAYYKNTDLSQKIQEELFELQKEIAQVRNEYEQVNRSYHELQQQLNQQKTLREQLKKESSQIQEKLEAYFPDHPLKITDSIALEAAYTTFTQNKTRWEKSKLARKETEEQLLQLDKELVALTSSWTPLQTQLVQLQEKAKNSAQYLTSLLDQKKALIGERSSLEVRKQLLQDQKHWHARVEEQHKLLSEQSKKKDVLGSTLKHEEQAKTNVLQEIQQLEFSIEQWSAQQSTAFQAKRAITSWEHWTSLDGEWLKTERLFFEQLNMRETKTNTLFEEASQALNKHQELFDFDCSEQEALQQKSVHQLAYTTALEEKGKLDKVWENNETVKQKHAQLLQAKQNRTKKAQEWSQLNALIGSSDGKKFRKMAQEYTLDILLRYANQHLSLMSKRYTLQRIPKSLSLQVIDHDMGYEIRSVFSLSGGESFLVSLALALALSSLSSTKMNVETLFIDEGFGTLDAETLSVALDALESLQHQGKKVGVISHVQEMTERIGVKIHIKKLGNGRSTIEVIEH